MGPLVESPSAAPRVLGLEAALVSSGVGRFHARAAFVCGLANAADAVEVLATGFLLPTAGAELRLGAAAKGALQASVFVGMLLGALLGGAMADARGRRLALTACMAITAFFGALTACVPGSGSGAAAALIGCRALAGVGVGGSAPLAFSYASELTPAAHRGRMNMYVASTYMLGALLTPALAALLLPHAGWRGFSIAAAMPAAVCGVCVVSGLPESPRWLLVRGRSNAAMRVLRHIADVNRVAGPPRGATLERLPLPSSMALPGASGKEGIAGWVRRVGALLRCRATRRTTLALACAWFTISFGWYGNMLYLPTLFAAREGGGPGRASATAPPPALAPASGAGGVADLPSAVYLDSVIVALANLPGNVASIWLIDWAGRKRTLMANTAMGGTAAVLLAFAPRTAAWSVAAGTIFNGLTVGGWNALAALTAEAFPTPVRTTAGGLVSACGRIGGASSGLLQASVAWGALGLGDVAPLLIGGAMMMVGCAAVSAGIRDDTAGRALVDTLDGRGGQEAAGGGGTDSAADALSDAAEAEDEALLSRVAPASDRGGVV